MINVESFFEPQSATFSYVVYDELSRQCAIIDPVLDYNQYTGQSSTHSADKIIDFIRHTSLQTKWLLETHIHADHITATCYLKNKLGGTTAIGEKITTVLELWTPFFETTNDTATDGSQFDTLLADGDQIPLGESAFTVMHTPGHTPACSSYLIEDHLFVGDTLFAPARGTARCDFPGGSTQTLYDSVMRLYQLPDTTKVYLCHDYPENDEQLISMTSIGEQKAHNIMLNADTTKSQFIALRTKRDKTLSAPKLLFPSIQCNSRLGDFGEPSSHGKRFIKIPVDAFDQLK